MKFPEIPIRTVLKKFKTGEIAIEDGGDGPHLRFDCDCIDALPFCKARCCALPGISITNEELERLKKLSINSLPVVTTNKEDGSPEMAHRSDTYCRCNDPKTRTCKIYADRPKTCSDFHCTRGSDMRGWKLDLNRFEG